MRLQHASGRSCSTIGSGEIREASTKGTDPLYVRFMHISLSSMRVICQGGQVDFAFKDCDKEKFVCRGARRGRGQSGRRDFRRQDTFFVNED